jgi:antitoxin (DNA-binding transcriptional repressor) of toxin-antitoxin stability system
MKFITVRDFRSRPAQVWKDLEKNDDMILTSNGKPIALMTPISESNMESTVRSMRKARALAAVGAMQTRSLQNGNDSTALQEINNEIKAARQGRKKC